METPKAVTKNFADIEIGDSAQFTTVVTAEMVDGYARLSGDYSPLHTDEDFAAGTVFGKRIAYGNMAGMLFARLDSMHLIGHKCLHLSQTLHYKKPLFLNTGVIITGRVSAKSDALQTLTIALEMRDAHTQEVLTAGESLVRVLE